MLFWPIIFRRVTSTWGCKAFDKFDLSKIAIRGSRWSPLRSVRRKLSATARLQAALSMEEASAFAPAFAA